MNKPGREAQRKSPSSRFLRNQKRRREATTETYDHQKTSPHLHGR